MSWNCNGGPSAALVAFIVVFQPDLVILQEYSRGWDTVLLVAGYGRQIIQEKHVWPLIGGQLVSDGNSSYCVLYKATKFTVVDNLALLDYRTQPNNVAVCPPVVTVSNTVNQARDQGFEARLPAMMKLRDSNNNSHTVTLFNWHAHTPRNPIQDLSFQRLENSVQFCRAVREAGDNDLVILAGDLNNENPLDNHPPRLGGLTGISIGINHIFANSGAHTYSDLAMEAARVLLMSSRNEHTAVGALIDY